jgi:hypothetical protein
VQATIGVLFRKSDCFSFQLCSFAKIIYNFPEAAPMTGFAFACVLTFANFLHNTDVLPESP